MIEEISTKNEGEIRIHCKKSFKQSLPLQTLLVESLCLESRTKQKKLLD